jgi:hypothetical protein
MKPLSLLGGVLCLSLAAFGADGNGNGNGNGNDTPPGQAHNGKVIHETRDAHTNQSNTNTTISYHGGPVITGTTNVYFILYGNWPDSSILVNLAQSIGGSSYFNINTTYSSSTGSVANSVHYSGLTSDNYSHGTSLSDSAIQAIVAAKIGNGLPKDTNGVYFVLTSPDVHETSGFCSQYCGWHTHGTIAGSDIKYAFVGNPATQCLSSCSAQSVSPNNNPGMDAMASIFAHELEESVTDPDLNAWYDRRGAENADKCAWTFGSVTPLPNGSYWNVNLGGLNYLIQQNWVNSGSGFCSMSH